MAVAVAVAVMGGVASGDPIPEDARLVLAAEADDIDAIGREIRKEYPQYADWSDAELAEAISRKHIAKQTEIGEILCWHSFRALDVIRDYHEKRSGSSKGASSFFGGLILEESRLARDLRNEAEQWGVMCGVRHDLHNIVPSN